MKELVVRVTLKYSEEAHLSTHWWRFTAFYTKVLFPRAKCVCVNRIRSSSPKDKAEKAVSCFYPLPSHLRRQRQPPRVYCLVLFFSTMVGGVRRTLSSSSTSSEPSSPFLTARDSTTALILVNDDPVANSPFDFSSDDEDDAHFELNARPPSKPSTPPLPASIVFVYLVDPFVKLGATLLLHSSLSLAHGLSALLISTMLAAFARQLWYMLARHLRKSDIEDVVLDAFARGRGKERQRTAIRNSMRVATAVMKILLVSLYLKGRHIVIIFFPHILTTLQLPSRFCCLSFLQNPFGPCALLLPCSSYSVLLR